jgi:hypothetical protein
VHEVAHAIDPETKVVYTDHDPIVLGQSRAMLARIDNATIIRGDLRQPQSIIAHPELATLIDWQEPVALLLIAVLHFVTDEDEPASILEQFRQVMARGSYLTITHIHHDGDDDAVRQILDIYRGASVPLVMRTSDEIAALYGGFDLIEPGLVPLPDWRPDPRSYPAGEVWGLGGVGRKTALWRPLRCRPGRHRENYWAHTRTPATPHHLPLEPPRPRPPRPKRTRLGSPDCNPGLFLPQSTRRAW